MGRSLPVSGPVNVMEMLFAGVIGTSSESRAFRKLVWNSF